MPRVFLLFAVLGLVGCQPAPEAAKRRYLERGQRFFAAGRHQEASINVRKALQYDPQFGEAHYALGLIEQAQGSVRGAYLRFRRAAQLLPRHVEVRVRLADLMMNSQLQEGDHGKALRAKVAELAAEIHALDPQSVDWLRLKGNLALAEGQPKEAVAAFSQARQMDPANADIGLGYVRSLFAAGRAAEAADLAHEMIGRQKTYAPLYDVLYAHYVFAKRMGDAEQIRKTQVENLSTDADSRLQLAEHYWLVNRPAEGEAVIQELVERGDKFGDVRLKLGDFYVRRGAWDEALAHYREGARSSRPTRAAYQKRMAQILIGRHNPGEARKVLDAVLEADPADAEARSLRAGLLLQGAIGGAIDKAIQEYRIAIEHAPDNPVLRFHLGRAYLRRGKLAEARVQFQEAADRRETYLAPLLGLAQVALATGQNHDALRQLDQILSYDSRNPNVRILRAAALTALGTYGEARGELLRLVKEFPDNGDVRLQLGLLYVAEKKYRDAEEIFRKLHQPGQGDLRPLEGLIETYISQAQAGRAIELLQEELRKAPNAGPLRWALASTAMHSRLYDLAIDQYNLLIVADPSSADLRYRIGEVYARKGDRPRAIENLERARALAPGDPAPLGLLAQLIDLEGRRADALAIHRHLLKLQPDDPFAMNNVAYLLAGTGGDLNEALRLAEAALRKLPHHPNVSDTIGLIYLKKNDADTALHIFSNLADKHRDNATFRYHLAEALVKKGDRARARTELEAALTHRPTGEIGAQIQRLLAAL